MIGGNRKSKAAADAATSTKFEEYKLVLKKENIDEVLQNNKEDKTTAYLILQNNYLHSVVESMKDQINELKNQNEELEEDNDRLQTSKTYISGLAKNRFEIAVEYKHIIAKQNEIIDSWERLSYAILTKTIGFHLTFYLFAFLYIFYSFAIAQNVSYENTLFLVILMTHVVFYVKDIHTIKKRFDSKQMFRQIYDEIAEKEADIQKMESANSYFFELIDNY